MRRHIVLFFYVAALSFMLSTHSHAEPRLGQVREFKAIVPEVPACSIEQPGCAERVTVFVEQILKYMEVCTLAFDMFFTCHQHFLSMDQQLERQQRDKSGQGPLFDGSMLNYLRVIRYNLDATFVIRYQGSR